MTVNRMQGTLFTALSALNGRTLSTLSHVNGQSINNAIVFDNFTRADSGTLGTAVTGQTWTLNGSGTFAISSNTALFTHGSPFTTQVWIDTTIANCSVQATFGTVKIGNGIWFRGSGGQAGILFAATDAGANYGCSTFDGISTFTRIFTTSSVTPSNGDTIKVVMSGTSLTFYVNGVSQGNVTSSFNQTSTRFGFYGGTVSANDGATYTEFIVTL